MSTNMLEAALAHAGQGYPVFPVAADKRPLTKHGLNDASTEPEQLTVWWACWPKANIGMVTGVRSGVVVIDVDPRHGGDDALHDLERDHGALPVTWSVRTPSGGQHFYLAHPGISVANSVGALGPGLDVRGDGGYVVVPPSLGPRGRRYEPDDDAPAARVPGWLLERLTGPSASRAATRPRTPADTWIMMVSAGLPQGERNHGLARLVGHLLAQTVDPRLVLELAQLVNERNRPPMPATEVERVVESIAGRELARRIGRQR
ncbi:MAG: hypothetical protein QOK49_1813 [Baekduia sp.]|jgi:hypothetical protein|nr:hypothetical protein [Baekduia sp.]